MMVKRKNSGGNILKLFFIKHKKTVLVVIMIILLIAGILDLKYEGLFFQLLPESVQSYLADIL